MVAVRQADLEDGKYRTSVAWVKVALDITNPWPGRHNVVCNDDCDRCPLHTHGCQERCMRWDELVCSDCPCLGSRASVYGPGSELRTVHPKTCAPEPPRPELLLIHDLRKRLQPGVPLRLPRRRTSMTDVPDSDPMQLFASWMSLNQKYRAALEEIRAHTDTMNTLREQLLEHGVTVQQVFAPSQQPPAQTWQPPQQSNIAVTNDWQQPSPTQAQSPPAPDVFLPPQPDPALLAPHHANNQIEFGTNGVVPDAEGYVTVPNAAGEPVSVRVVPKRIAASYDPAAAAVVSEARATAGVVGGEMDGALKNIAAQRMAAVVGQYNLRVPGQPR